MTLRQAGRDTIVILETIPSCSTVLRSVFFLTPERVDEHLPFNEVICNRIVNERLGINFSSNAPAQMVTVMGSRLLWENHKLPGSTPRGATMVTELGLVALFRILVVLLEVAADKRRMAKGEPVRSIVSGWFPALLTDPWKNSIILHLRSRGPARIQVQPIN